MQVKVASPQGSFMAGVIIKSKLAHIYETRPGDYWIVGEPGATFAVEVENLGSRLEVLCSIDGRNTLKDEEASWDKNTGLVIPAYGRYKFAVWRQDLEGGREFIFGTDITDSVVSQVGGDTSNAGVIGLASWQEKRVQRPLPPTYDSYPTYRMSAGGQSVTGSYSARSLSAGNEAAPVASASAGPTMDMNMDMSTGIGAYKSDHLGTTSFTRGAGPDILLIRYASLEALKAAGIAVYQGPDAFPGSSISPASGYERLSSPKE